VAIPIGVNTWVWKAPFASKDTALFNKVKKMGFDVVELPIEDPSLVDAKKIRAALNRTGLGVTVCGAFGPSRDLTSDRATDQKEGLAYIRWCLEFCEAVGSRVFAGPMYSAVGKARLVSKDQKKREWNRAVKNLRKAATWAGDRGVRLAIEPLNRFETDLINLSSQAVQLCKDVGDKAMGIHLDTFHMNIEEKDTEKAIKLAGRRLVHFHASESDRGTPGSAQVDWKGAAHGLKAVKYEGAVVIETFTPAVKEIARAAAIWRKLVPRQDDLARDGLRVLRKAFK